MQSLIRQDPDWSNYPGRQQKLMCIVNGYLLVLVRPGLFLAVHMQQQSEPTIKKLRYSTGQAATSQHSDDASIDEMEVLTLTPSPDQRFIAVHGRHYVSVLTVPAIFGRDMWLKPPMNIGEFDIGTDIHNPVVKCLWHPLGRSTSRNLCVVMRNGGARMYDLFADIQKSESVFRLHLTESPRKGYFMPSDLEVVSACFGHGEGWLPMTLFCLLRNGDVMSLCPVMPRNGKISRSHLESLLKQCRQHLSDAEGQSNEFLLFRQRVDFLETLLDTALTPDPRDENTLHYSSPKMSNYESQAFHEYSLYPLGPYRMIPTPTTSLDQAAVACDLQFTTFTKTIKDGEQFQVPYISISYCGGFVDVCIVDEDQLAFGPAWYGSAVALKPNDADEQFEYIPALWVIESVDLGLGNLLTDSPLKLSSFVSNPELLFVYHNCGLHYLDLSQSFSKISSCFYSDDGDSDDAIVQLHKLIGKQNLVTVGGVLSTRQHESQPVLPVHSIALWTDILAAPRFFFTTSNNDFSEVTIDILNRIKYARATKTIDDSVESIGIKHRVSASKNPSLLRELPIENDLPFIRKDQTQLEVGPVIPDLATVVLPQGTKGKYPDCINKANYEVIATESMKLREHVITVQMYMTVLDQRMKLLSEQKSLLEKDLEDLSKSSFQKTSTNLEERLKAALSRQQLISKRIDICTGIAMEYSQPSLSQAELDWAEELNQHLRKFKNMRTKFAQAKEMIKAIEAKQKNADTDLANTHAETLGSYQMRNISNIIEKESSFLQDLRDKVKELEQKVDILSLQ